MLSILEFQARRSAAGAQGRSAQPGIPPTPSPAAPGRDRNRPACTVDDVVSTIPDGGCAQRKEKRFDSPALAIEEKTITPAIEDNAASGQPRQCAAGKEVSQAPGRGRFKGMNPSARSRRQHEKAAPGTSVEKEPANRRRLQPEGASLHPDVFSQECGRLPGKQGAVPTAFTRRNTARPKADTLETRIVIAGILQPAFASRSKEGADSRPVDAKERPQQPDRTVQQNPVRHPGKADSLRRSCSAHRYRLSLIVARMRRKNGVHPRLHGNSGKKIVTLAAGRRLQTGSRFPALPTTDAVRNAVAGTERTDPHCFFGRTGAQIVIDRAGGKGDAGKTPGRAKHGESHEQPCGIAATGNGDEQMRGALETVQKSAGCLKGGIIRAGHGVSSVRNQQDRRLCSEETLLFTALEASG